MIIIIYQNKIKYLTIAYVQDFDQNFTLIAFLRLIHITVIIIEWREKKKICRNFFNRKDYFSF